MPMKTKKLTFAALIPLALCAAQEVNAATTEHDCPGIAIASRIQSSRMGVTQPEFTRYSDHTLSSIGIENRYGRSMAAILVTVDYRNKAAQHILTGIYYAETSAIRPLPLRYLVGIGLRQLPQTILPGEQMRITSASDVVTPECPTLGLVTRIVAHFDDGDSVSESSPDWSTDPAVREARQADLTVFPGTLPVAFSASFLVGSDGHASLIATEEGKDQIAKWFLTQLDNWTIIPGECDSSATDSKTVTMLVELHRNRNESPTLSKPKVPYVLVEIFPQAGQNQKSLVLVGGVQMTEDGPLDPLDRSRP